MNVAIVEDHPSEAARLAGLVEAYAAQARVPVSVRAFHGAEALLEGYRPHAYTAIFLDIYLEGMDGVSAARKLRAVDRSAVLIFLTSSGEHMPEAFSVHAFDYIPKPAARDRVFAALNDILLKDIQYTDGAKLEFKHEGNNISIPYGELAVVQTSEHNYLEILDADGHRFKTRLGFQSVSEALTKDPRFLLTLRGVLVNMDHIERIDNGICHLTNGETVQLNVRNARELNAIWQNYRLEKIRCERREKRRRQGT